MNSRLLVVTLLACVVGCHSQGGHEGVVFQTSTIPALMEGVYAGDTTLEEVRQQGDFGLGTVENLDGELLLVDGDFYQVRADGRAYRPDLSTRTPLAVACFFKPQRRLTVEAPLSYPQLLAAIDQLRPSPNIPYAIRITGAFELVKTRSVPRQEPPFRRLIEITDKQPTFDLAHTRGTMVGFWFPGYAQGLNVPGYHLHFLNSEKAAGGHVLDCRPTKVKIEVADLPDLAIRLPRTPQFMSADLQQTRPGELHKVEQAPTSKMAR